jgi:hypothetical protein
LSPEGSQLIYSTYLGGKDREEAPKIKVDAAGAAYVAGTTLSSDFPVRSACCPPLQGVRSTFVTKMNTGGNGLIFSTLMGNFDRLADLALDASGNVYLAGDTFLYPPRPPELTKILARSTLKI